ncbi:DNA polymerase Y family protein [Myceligenerans salitolerans]|uniref:DNA polymerase Y family protein n=1 Tax=Myceligenerans salitolerans TaxID=1230528 RepID=A0ABS3I5Q2_9MICO|nr:DNA polymerase Y family protein [Myceligenerans salitolerans]MBO0608344.1 DNA polymerase Y family protein [Myceligenerans salitolerans]
MSGVRTAVVWVPDWPVVAAMAAAGTGAHLPAAVLGAGQRVVAVSAPARAAGVRRGMRRRTAQQQCAGLVVLLADDARDAAGFEPVAAAAETVVAGIEVVRPGLLLLGSDGAARYHGSEHELARELTEAVARDAGHECRAGVADGFLAAVLAARDETVVPHGGSAAWLAPRPAADLRHARPDDSALADLLDLWGRLGLRTLGDVAALPAGSVRARFGPLGTWARRLALAEDARPPARRRAETGITATTELDPPASRADVAAFAARRVAEDLHAQLVARGMACGRVVVTADAADPVTGEPRTCERVWRTDDATGMSAARLTDRVRWQLTGWLTHGTPEPAPITRITLTADEIAPAGATQPALWGASAGEGLRAVRAAERVQALRGAPGVLAPRPQGGRDPRSRIQFVPFGEDVPPERAPDRPWPGALPDPAPAVVLTDPLPVRVLDATGADVVVDVRLGMSGEPALVRSERGAARVTDWGGPWPVVERWWRPDGAARSVYLQIVTDDGDGLLLAQTDGTWRLEARYD